MLSADGKKGYYSSAREGGLGDKDIYVVEPGIGSKKLILTVIKGRLLENGKVFGQFNSSASSGNYLVSLPSGYNYKINYYHPVLGDRAYNNETSKVTGYAEKIININFGDGDTIPRTKAIVVTDADSVKKA